MKHSIKILPKFFQPVVDRRKTFEVRLNDRNYQVGDIVLLNEFDGEGFSGRHARVQILYVTDFNQEKGYVVFSFKPLDYYPDNGSGKDE